MGTLCPIIRFLKRDDPKSKNCFPKKNRSGVCSVGSSYAMTVFERLRYALYLYIYIVLGMIVG